MTQDRLAALLAAALRQQRELRALTQQGLAERAGVSQATIARIENGDRAPSTAMLQKLLAALGVQLTVDVEPLDAHLDAQLDRLGTRTIGERIADTDLERVTDRLGDFPYALTGCTAAMLQGAPVPVEAVDIAVTWRDADAFTEWLTAAYGQRWHPKWQEFGHLRLDPRAPGDHRWQTVAGEIRATMCDDLPETIEVRHGGRGYQVVPLPVVEVTDERTAALLSRWRHRRTIGDATGDDQGGPGDGSASGG